MRAMYQVANVISTVLVFTSITSNSYRHPRRVGNEHPHVTLKTQRKRRVSGRMGYLPCVVFTHHADL